MISLACVLAFFMKTPEFHRTSKYEIKLRKIVVKEAVLPAVLMFFLSMSYSCVNSFIAIYGGLRGVENIGSTLPCMRSVFWSQGRSAGGLRTSTGLTRY